MILNVPVIELMELWAELVLAHRGINSFGGDTAELYAYRFMGRSPHLEAVGIHSNNAEAKHAFYEARCALLGLLDLFAHKYEVRVFVDGMPLDAWRESNIPFNHRVPVRIG